MSTETETQMSGNSSNSSVEKIYSLFLPVLVMSLAFLFWIGFQTWQLVNENTALETAIKNQEQLVVNSSKMRKSLDAIASETQKLADQGNPNAKLLVDELKKHGVSINANASTTATQ